jgi:hypothetical protein
VAERLAEDFPRYLEASLEILGSEAPLHLAAIRDRLAGRSVVLRIGTAEPVRICLRGQPPFVHRGAEGEIQVGVSVRDLECFLRGQLTLEEAIETNRLTVRAQLDDLLPALDGLSAWLHGCLRSSSSPALHGRYLTGSDLTREEHQDGQT